MQIVAPETLVVVENSGKQRIIVPGNNETTFMCRWLKFRWLAGLMGLPSKSDNLMRQMPASCLLTSGSMRHRVCDFSGDRHIVRGA